MIGQKKSFQAVRKVSIASTAMAGRAAGTTTEMKVRKRARSVDNAGFDQLVRHGAGDVLAHEEDTERGDQRRQDDRLQMVGPAEAAPSSRYSGMMPIWIGTIIVSTQNPSRKPLPRKRSLANAKPPSVQNATVPIVMHAGDDQRIDQTLVERGQLQGPLGYWRTGCRSAGTAAPSWPSPSSCARP